MRHETKHYQILVIVLIIILLPGCSTIQQYPLKNERQKLKVLYFDEKEFFNDFGMLYSALNPEIDFEIVTIEEEQGSSSIDIDFDFQKIIDKIQPDILFLSLDQYQKLSHDGKLTEISSMIKQDKYDISNLAPGTIDLLKSKEGELFGLSPFYYSKVLFYNIDLFEKYRVTFPVDKMSWEDLLEKSVCFTDTISSKDRIYGFYAGGDLYQLGNAIGSSYGLDVVDLTGMKMAINTPNWEYIYAIALEAQKTGAFYSPDLDGSKSWESYESFYLNDPFLSGRMAMTIAGPEMLEQLKRAKIVLKENFKWDIVTVPTNPNNPDYTNTTSINQVFSIYNNSTNKKEAWKFIKYIHSNEFARITSKSPQTGKLHIRSSYLKDVEGHNLSAYYTLKPLQNDFQNLTNTPIGFSSQFEQMASEKLRMVLYENVPIKSALDDLQQEAQQLLDSAYQDVINE